MNDETSLNILETARCLFVEQGIEEVSMHQIAKSAGVGQGTLYRRYPNKSKLCLDIMRAKLEQFMLEIEQDLSRAASEPAVVRLKALITKMILLVNEDLDWIKAIVHSERLAETKMNYFETPPYVFLTGKIKELLDEASGKQELRKLDTIITTHLIASMWTPDLFFYLNCLGYSPEQMAEHYCRSFIDPLFI